MNNIKHTPGPWVNDGGPIVSLPRQGPGYVHVIASVPGGNANARLIAAAPELLEACLALIKSDDLQAAIDKARAAIAKAQAVPQGETE